MFGDGGGVNVVGGVTAVETGVLQRAFPLIFLATRFGLAFCVYLWLVVSGKVKFDSTSNPLSTLLRGTKARSKLRFCLKTVSNLLPMLPLHKQ